MGIDLDKFREKWRKERCVICPYCEHEHDPQREFESFSRLVTFHGEEEPQRFICQVCGEEFFVKEWVDRTFEEKKTMKEFD